MQQMLILHRRAFHKKYIFMTSNKLEASRRFQLFAYTPDRSEQELEQFTAFDSEFTRMHISRGITKF